MATSYQEDAEEEEEEEEAESEAASKLPSLSGQSDNLGAVAPNVCYRCHGDKQELQQIAGPHQICGPNDFNCTTCHDAHGKVLESSRQQLCLNCHQSGTPTMAWHSSTHAVMGVACTDCHSPHASANVPQVVGISHFDVARPKRLPMSVNDPVVCYRCHADVYSQISLTSHHPVPEGKMFCGDCHDAHGQMEGNLRAETLNLLCWKCHAEKQGPFAYEHPPVTENCAYCHKPNGTVQNNLLPQPTTFLCLRCHNGHRDGNHGGGARLNIDTTPQIRAGLYTDWFSLEYSRTMRAFQQNDEMVFGNYNSISTSYGLQGVGYSNWASENYTEIDRIKSWTQVTPDTDMYVMGWLGNTHNEFRESDRKFYGVDARVSNQSLDGLTSTVYGKTHVQNNSADTMSLNERYPGNLNYLEARPPQTMYTPNDNYLGLVDRHWTSLGWKNRWRPFYDSRGIAKGFAVVGGYEWAEIKRSNVTYELDSR